VEISERFDLVFANQIVEHLVYPIDFTKRVAGWLRPGGRLVVTTPNADYVKSDLPTFSELGDPAQYDAQQFTADGDGHFFAYRAAELTDVFEKSGFTRVTVRYFETPFISGYLKVRHLHSFVPASVLSSFDRLSLRLPGIGRRLAHQLMVTGSLLNETTPTQT